MAMTTDDLLDAFREKCNQDPVFMSVLMSEFSRIVYESGAFVNQANQCGIDILRNVFCVEPGDIFRDGAAPIPSLPDTGIRGEPTIEGLKELLARKHRRIEALEWTLWAITSDNERVRKGFALNRLKAN